MDQEQLRQLASLLKELTSRPPGSDLENITEWSLIVEDTDMVFSWKQGLQKRLGPKMESREVWDVHVRLIGPNRDAGAEHVSPGPDSAPEPDATPVEPE